MADTQIHRRQQKTELDTSDGHACNGKQENITSTKEDKRSIYVVFTSLVLDLLAFTLILPLLPSLLDYYGTHDQDGLYATLRSSVNGFRELVGAPDTPRWNSVLFGGLIGSLFSLLQFMASPVIGAASDVYGRRPVLLISMIGVGISYAVWAVSHNFSLFVLSRIIGGISKGNVSLSTAVIADVLPQGKRGKGMALIGIAFSIGFVFGPLIGAVFSRWARAQEGTFYVAPAIFALILAAADILFIFVFFKETLPQDKRAVSIASGWENTSYLINPVSLFRFSSVKNIPQKDMKLLQKTGATYFIYLLLFSGLEFTLTFLTHNRLNYDSMQQGKMFFFIGTVMVIVQGGYVRRVMSGKEIKIASQGMSILIPAFILMAFSWSATVIYIALVLFSFASATVVPCLTTVVSNFGGEDQKGVIMGIFRSLGALARAIGPIMSSILYWSCGAEVCYVLGGVLLFIPLAMLIQMKPRDRKIK